jgi:transcriptional regulator with XRE-family HTH domain/quercetin dioxygenase-like cupin family protein
VSSPDVPPIGGRIREERVRRNWTLRGLAREIGVSASLISQIETGKSQPSVSTLYAITTALGLPIEQLFTASDDGERSGDGELPRADGADPEGAAPEPTVVRLGAPETAGAPGPRTLVDQARRVGPIVHPEARETLRLESGVTWELLGQVPGARVEFLCVTYPPGSASAPAEQMMRHTGIEFGYLVSGELTLSLGFEEHHLRAHDAFSFESSTPHRYRNDATEPAVGIWFVLEDN